MRAWPTGLASPPTPMPCECGEWAARARAQLHWFSTAHAAWLRHSEGADWTGWEAVEAQQMMITAPGWQPWSAVSDASEEPYVRWFCEALTNAAFNELDRHVLQVSALAATAASSASASSPSGLGLGLLTAVLSRARRRRRARRATARSAP